MKFNKNLKEAVGWLCRSQEINSSGGVSKFYHINNGWYLEDYQEVSGYVIETFLELYKKTKKEEYLKRAIKIGDWEVLIQHSSGKWEYVFDTGQVILGLTDLFNVTKDKRYINSAVKAANWLVKTQSNDGHWKKNIFACGIKNRLLRMVRLLKYDYNTRTAWSLLKVWEITKNIKYKNAAIKNLNVVLKNQMKNGYYKNATQITHFLTYTARGLLESGIILENNFYLNSVKKYIDSCIKNITLKGFFSAEFDSNWDPLEPNCSCLTANCQLSIILMKFSRIKNDSKYNKAVERLINYVSRTQDLGNKDMGILGGIAGSSPLGGCYEKNKILSWATKFYIDALLVIKENYKL